MDINAAVEAGVIGGVKGLTGAGVVVGLLHHFHKGFRKNVGPSGKVALIISACFFKVALDSEHEIHRQQRSRWIDTVDAAVNCCQQKSLNHRCFGHHSYLCCDCLKCVERSSVFPHRRENLDRTWLLKMG